MRRCNGENTPLERISHGCRVYGDRAIFAFDRTTESRARFDAENISYADPRIVLLQAGRDIPTQHGISTGSTQKAACSFEVARYRALRPGGKVLETEVDLDIA